MLSLQPDKYSLTISIQLNEFNSSYKNRNLTFVMIKLEKNFECMSQWASWHVSLSIPENRTQKYLKLPSVQNFEVDILKNFQKWKFLFSSIFSKFCLEKNFHVMTQEASWHVSLSISKNCTQKYPKLTSLQHFEVDIPRNFQKWKFSFFWIFSKIFFWLMPGFLRLLYK